jgi:hypothetical protein
MHMKVPSTTVIRFANLSSLVFRGKNKVGYFLDRPHMVAAAVMCTFRVSDCHAAFWQFTEALG